MVNKIKPLPCPCCGSGRVYSGVLAHLVQGVFCKKCGLRMIVDVDPENSMGSYKIACNNALDEAIRRWNIRYNIRRVL